MLAHNAHSVWLTSRGIGQTKPKLVYYQNALPKKSKAQEFRESRFSSREVRISWYHIFSVEHMLVGEPS